MLPVFLSRSKSKIDFLPELNHAFRSLVSVGILEVAENYTSSAGGLEFSCFQQ